jgi:hypothetical protein
MKEHLAYSWNFNAMSVAAQTTVPAAPQHRAQ